MGFLQLKVVIWKNYVIRKRHYFLTSCEVILPILLFLLIAYGRSKISGLNKVEIQDPTYNYIERINYENLNLENTNILYTPNNEFYNDVIKRTQDKFQIYNNNIKGFSTVEELLEYYAKHSNGTVIAIIFDRNPKPEFKYTIRYHEKYFSLETDTLYRNQYTFEPGTGTQYLYKGILAFQKALDISYIEKVLGKKLEDNVTLSALEFPYPPHKADSGLSSLFIHYLPLITLFSFIFICPAVLKRVVEEKHSGIKELMKMSGMESWMLWLGWFIHGMTPMLISVACIVILMKVPFFDTPYPPIEFTNGLIIFGFLLLYCMAATVFCFFISTLFRKPTLAMITGILVWILSYFIPKYLLETYPSVPFWINVLLNLFPNMALHYGYTAIATYEERELGIQWNNWYLPGSGGYNEITMLQVFLLLIFDIIFYTVLSFYIDNINPGKYGVRKSIFYPITSLKQRVSRIFGKTLNSKVDNESVHLEYIEEGHGLTKGIELHNLYKSYGSKVAVNNLNLDVYKQQITVLLGHNGAGKSTTMAMITGMIESSSGSIKINGKDMKTHSEEIRQSLGLCPQHNLLFPDLTVAEHLEFFAKLKGKTSDQAKTEIKKLLNILNLEDKANSMANTLSGGMKRKLCLGMAVIGDSKVLILDEPTSGMDPQSRRELWDLLLAWRGEKTILITTHFMEEADALGDWIAIMGDGYLQCYGTPVFLKKKYDTGYHLSLIIKPGANVDVIETRIKKLVIGAKQKSLNGNNLDFILPFENDINFADMFEHLESNKEELNIENMSVTVTTLEDVFLKAKVEPDENFKENILDIDSDGNRKIWLTVRALFKKRCQFIIKKHNTYIVPLCISILSILLCIFLSRNSIDHYGENGPKLSLKLGTYGTTGVFYNGTPGIELSDKLKSSYRQLVSEQKGKPLDVQDVSQAIINNGINNIAYYREHMIAAAEIIVTEDNNIDVTCLYNGLAVHSLPISLNLITNALAKTFLGDQYSISVSNWPLQTINSHVSPKEWSEVQIGLLWLIIIPIGCLFVLGSCILFPHMELSTNFTQLQIMCGVKSYLYWLVNFFIDFVMFIAAAFVMVLITLAWGPPFRGWSEAGFLFLILSMYGMCGIPFAYLFSRKKSASGAFALFIILGIFLGVLLTVIVQVLQESADEYYMGVGEDLKVFLLIFFPQFGLTYSGVQFARKAIKNHNMNVMPRIKMQGLCSYDPNPCCFGSSLECEEYKSYWNLLKANFGLMFVSFFVYIIINIFFNTYLWIKIKARVTGSVFKLKNIAFKNGSYNIDQSDETDQIINDKDNNSKTGTLKANKLGKNYSGKQVVKNMNFVLEKGKCLGILGVNGAGKTTTFRMLTREEYRDKGIVFADEHGIDQDSYLAKLGYCPQSDALNFVLTGRQILTLIAQLRGIEEPANLVSQFLTLFELTPYADVPCGHYSGGNKRKLNLAIAIIGFPDYVLLDEPTNGVDPSARRKFWNLIRAVQNKQHTSFILTSHSMAECEALCNDLKIMKNGTIHKQGTISKLKEEIGGFSVKLKLKNKNKESCKDVVNLADEGYDDVDGCASDTSSDCKEFKDVDALKRYLQRNYNGEVKDEHSGLLHYYIKDKNKRWSALFGEIEEIKIQNPHLIEDYVISEASLEDVFLSVANSDNERSDLL